MSGLITASSVKGMWAICGDAGHYNSCRILLARGHQGKDHKCEPLGICVVFERPNHQSEG